MGATVEGLRRLQEIELQLAAIRRDRESKVRRVEIHGKQLRQIEERLAENHRAVKAQQMKVDALSLDVAAHEDSVAKHRQALNKAKTNKEYAAILTAMNTEKADSSKLETTILQLMDELQMLKNAGAQLEVERDKARLEMSTAEETLQSYDAGWQSERERLQAERDSATSGIPEQALSLFNRCAQRHDGEAMAGITRVRPKRDEFACSGCNMKVTLDIINALQTRDEVRLCGVCGRILYLDAALITKAKS